MVNRRIPNGTYGGVRGRGLIAPSYSIDAGEKKRLSVCHHRARPRAAVFPQPEE
ncbi:MAG TPA: hypothetical protein GXX34_11790 [Clostridia bacterium]|nr:hypothetical protein [Clostridia bacterium]